MSVVLLTFADIPGVAAKISHCSCLLKILSWCVSLYYLLLHASPCTSPPCFPRPPATAAGACEAVKERHRENSTHKFHACSLHPSSAVLVVEIVCVSSSRKEWRGGKTPTVNAQVSHTHLLCMKPHKHLFLWFVKACLGSISSRVWSQCWRVPRELWHTDWSCSPLQALRAILLLTEKAIAASHPSKSRKPSVHKWGKCGVVPAASFPFSAGIWRTQSGA